MKRRVRYNFYYVYHFEYFILVGLTFLIQLENLYILIPYTILTFINAVYLVVRAINITKNRA